MKFIDKANIILKAGNGGDGALAFHREKYVPEGGPSGGDGGHGGNIIFVGDYNTHTLLNLKNINTLKAQDGVNGQNKNRHGKNAPHLYFKVPIGTIVKDKNNQIIVDITNHNQEFIVAYGGKKGRGNARFANSKNRAPKIFERGALGEEKEIFCELKVLADIGIVGKPNAGKSTLINILTNKKAIIGDYPFTTINPQLGILNYHDNQILIADTPGLIKGASQGKGLGIQFLKHIERCKIILFLLDASDNYTNNEIYENYQILKKEIHNYDKNLDNKKQIIVFNKSDLIIDDNKIDELSEKFKDINCLYISALNHKNISELKQTIYNVWKENKDKNFENIEEDRNIIKIYKYKENNLLDGITLEKVNNILLVNGKNIEALIHRYPLKSYENRLLINKILYKEGFFNYIKSQKINDISIIKINDYEYEWKD